MLIAAITTMAYLFVIRGNVTSSDDGRTAIVLSASERDLVLGEMRGFLESIEAITNGLAEDNMEDVAQSAHQVGMASAGQAPVGLMAKLPIEFKTLGMATHKAFDDLAREATDMGDEKVALAKLGALMNNCTSCHATFRFVSDDRKGN
ncbi:MAG: hypothetical protein ACTSUY_01485 [Alphaproteobacteria bacterium]